MKMPIIIPDKAVRYILYQRTAYLRFPKTLMYRGLKMYLPFSIYPFVVISESILYKNKIKSLYKKDMENEYLSIKAYLPKVCSAILDIGCGIAGLDYYLYHHFHNNQLQLYLLDKSYIEKNVYYGYEKRGAFYNSLEMAKELLTRSGIPSCNIHLREASRNYGIDISSKFDLVVSLLSWGFHYPINAYLDRVNDLLVDDGVLVMDIRKGSNGIRELKRGFKETKIIFEDSKFFRVTAKKNTQ